VNPWWWVPIGLAAWLLVAIGIGMLIGPVLRRSSHTREALDQAYLNQEFEETPEKREPPQDERQAS
jgi:hypothetical protein